MMSMIEEKHTPNAISFVIEMPPTKVAEPEIKKRLEDQSAAYAPMVTLEQIQAKLEKAEVKRRASLHQTQSFEEKRTRVNERKSSLEQAALEQGTKIETTLSQAEKNRELARNAKKQKI